MPIGSKESFYIANSRLKNGDHNEFLKIYDRYSSGLFHFVIKFIKDTDTADDLVHDSFLILWNSRSNIKVNYPIESYIFKITRNLVYKKLKEKLRVVEMQKEILYKEETSNFHNIVEDQLTDAEYTNIYNSAVEQLPPQRKRIFKMSREEGLSYKEIADELGISVNTVKEHMSLAMRFMRDYIAKEHDVLLKAILLLHII